MTPIAYTVSPYLTRFLERAEATRQQIVLAPLPQRRELELQFAANIHRIDYGLRLINKVIPERTISTILANQIAFAMQRKKTIDQTQALVLGYKHALDFIKRDWLLNYQAVDIKTINQIYLLLTESKMLTPEKEIKEALSSIQATADNPYLQAAIAKLVFRQVMHNDPFAEPFSGLCSYLFLYKGGSDCRGLLVLEEGWYEDSKLFIGHYNTAIAKPNITPWIEYFIKTLALSVEKTYQKLYQNPNLPDQQSIGKLNERQKIILTLLDDPQAIITNRTVQKIFHVSQITASRDLAKLAMLGLLFTQGKGRSVRYTKM